MCAVHRKCVADCCKTQALCVHSDGPTGVQETVAFTTSSLLEHWLGSHGMACPIMIRGASPG